MDYNCHGDGSVDNIEDNIEYTKGARYSPFLLFFHTKGVPQ
jgi:hypothetical protein